MSGQVPGTWLVDCGNSALKLAALAATGPEPVRRLDRDLAALGSALESAERVIAVASSSQSLEALRQVVGDRLAVCGEDLILPEVGQYPTMGHDRVLAGIAASREHPACVVVDCGTATTITAWRRDSDYSGGCRTLGGLILPGAAACSAGLTAAAPHLPPVDAVMASPEALQTTTHGALGAALAIGYPGMVLRCLEAVCAAAESSTVLTTGGLAERWLPTYRPVPDLVLRGLQMVVE